MAQNITYTDNCFSCGAPATFLPGVIAVKCQFCETITYRDPEKEKASIQPAVDEDVDVGSDSGTSVVDISIGLVGNIVSLAAAGGLALVLFPPSQVVFALVGIVIFGAVWK
mgnify:CR=1 FL=1